MVTIVIISHSADIARGVKTLADQMTSGKVPIFAAGGLDEHTLGTSLEAIQTALQQAESPDGTLVLIDLGSALLNAEAALELLPPESREKIRLCAAPLVEGALAAAVQSSLGADLETVCKEAAQSLTFKREQFGAAPAELPQPSESLPPEALQIELILTNPHGLHARPAARFVQTAASFEADIQVRNLSGNRGPVSARSLNAVATLGALGGDRILLNASGPQAKAALEALSQLVQQGFGETEPPAPPSVQPSEPGLDTGPTQPHGSIRVVPIAAGFAAGPLALIPALEPEVDPHPPLAPETEWKILQAALETVSQSISDRRQRAVDQLGRSLASILDAHLLMLQDPDLLKAVRGRIESGRRNASQAWYETIQEISAAYESLPDEYQRQRLQDVRDIGAQVGRLLSGDTPQQPIHFDHPVILAAEELTPNQSVRLDPAQVLGIATVRGGPTSHSAILARALGIPAVSGIPPEVLALDGGRLLALDGASGWLWIDPDETVQTLIQSQRAEWQRENQRRQEQSRLPAVTRDGSSISVAANAGSLADAEAASHQGADGIGLLRTEFLFLQRSSAPTEEEQIQILAPIFDCMGGRLTIVRTLDVGGDKPIPYLALPIESNPFLGERAIRLSRRCPDLLTAQLRAILRSGLGHHPGVMFPMVSSLEDLEFARSMLEQAHRSLQDHQLPHAWPVPTGVMIEVPSAALIAERLAESVDFFSIGTNDLTQYTLAAERGHPKLIEYQDALHPSVLRLIRDTAQAGRKAGKWTGVCGELAGDPAAVPILIGLGIEELSLAPLQIPHIKETVRLIDSAAACTLAENALQAGSAREVRRIAEAFLQQQTPKPPQT